MKRFATMMAMGAMAAMTALPLLASSQPHTMSGFISDSRCAATHTEKDKDCVRKCISSGQKPVFVDDKKAVWKIDNPNAVSVSDEGKNVQVRMTMNPAHQSIHILEIKQAMNR